MTRIETAITAYETRAAQDLGPFERATFRIAGGMLYDLHSRTTGYPSSNEIREVVEMFTDVSNTREIQELLIEELRETAAAEFGADLF